MSKKEQMPPPEDRQRKLTRTVPSTKQMAEATKKAKAMKRTRRREDFSQSAARN